MQNMIGKVDLVMGSFSKTFASNGGFVACKDRRIKEYLRFYSAPSTFSNAIAPAQAAVVLKAFEIIQSDEGALLRSKLMGNILLLRNKLAEADFSFYGDPSAIVAVKMGFEGLARLVSRELAGAWCFGQLGRIPRGGQRLRQVPHAGHGEPYRKQYRETRSLGCVSPMIALWQRSKDASDGGPARRPDQAHGLQRPVGRMPTAVPASCDRLLLAFSKRWSGIGGTRSAA